MKKRFAVRKNIFTLVVLFFTGLLFCGKVNGQATCFGVIDGSTTEFCVVSGSITFSNAVAAGENVQWLTSGDGVFNDPYAQNPTYTPGPVDIANGYAFIYLDVYKDDPVDFCSVLPLVTLHIGSMNAIATPATQTICSGSALTNIVFSGGLSSTTYNWTRDNTATITGTAGTSGTGTIRGNLVNATADPVSVRFTITPTTGSCTGTPINAVVNVNPRVIASASITSQTTCSGSAITPIAVSSSANNTTYTWTRNNTGSVTGIASSGTSANITGTLTNTSGSPVTVTFTITPTANGCAGTAITSTVTVNPNSNVVTSTPALQSVCSGSPISNITFSGAGGGATYNWTRNNTAGVTGIASSGSGTISGTLTNTTTAPVYVTFTITPTTNSCSNRASVLVSPRPAATATPASQTICSGTAISPVLLTSNISNTTYAWTRNNTASVTGIANSGTGNIAGSLTNTTNSPVTVTFTITPSVNGCTGTAITATVTVTPAPNTATATPSNQTICSGGNVSSITMSGSGGGSVYNWSRDNIALATGIGYSGTGTINGQLINTTGTALTVRFTITPTRNGCVGTPVIANVVVNAASNSASATPPDQTVCSGTPVSQIVLSGATSYTWTRNNTATVTGIAASGTGNISGTLVNTTGAPVNVTFTVIPTIGGCTGLPVIASVLVNPRPTAVITGSQAVCTGGASPNLSIAFTGVAPWSFTYTDGSTPVSLSGSYANSYTFPVPALPAVYTVTTVSDANCVAQAGDITGSANITQQTYTFNASAGLNGNISPAGAIAINCGTNQTYTITPNSGFNVADVLVNGISVGAVTSYTFINVSAPHTISAVFSANAHTITASAGANGSISPSGAVAISNGASQAFTIAAAPCYQISNVLVDGVSIGAVSGYTFNNVTAPHTISASFTQTSYNIIAIAGANGNITPAGTTNVNCG
ncbi:MAG TPA: hypothetical protein PLY34_13795, partial [Ferruginibacter sp.]|nr:hypothetical protein [Ferruginibacter sp.]